MIWLAIRELAARRTSTGMTAFGLLTATLGFVVLTSTAQTTRAELHGDIERAWQSPYDLLVRPAGAVAALEARDGLVRPNYASGLAGGGITVEQLARIRDIPGVDVAAPIALVGAANWPLGGFGIDEPLDPGVYRLQLDSVTEAGMTKIPITTHYLVVADSGQVRYRQGTRDAVLTVGNLKQDCRFPVSCFAPLVCDPMCQNPADPPGYGIEVLQPTVVAGIDPTAEARLAGLDRCLVAGRYLTGSDHIGPAAGRDPPGTRIPALVADRTFTDETLVATLSVAPSARLGTAPARLSGWRELRREQTTAQELYLDYLPTVGAEVDEWPIWSVGDVSYLDQGTGLAAVDTAPDPTVYVRENIRLIGGAEETSIPPSARDRWFRPVAQHGYVREEGNRYWAALGRYDPSCVSRFDPLAGGALETYAAPEVRLPGGGELLPTRSLGAYVTSPPMVLTTLQEAAWLSDPDRFSGRPGAAFISVIRVRIAGAEHPSKASQARLARVAADIKDATGLQVDVVKGASPRSISIRLPAGDFGRPALTVTESWAVKGVAVGFTRAVSTQNIVVFLLSLAGAAILVGMTAYTAVRRRRGEFGVLRALGWRSWRIATLVEIEMVVLGVVVGGLAATVGAMLSLSSAVLAIPLATGVAMLAAVVPALPAARGSVVAVMERPGPIRGDRLFRTSATLALRELVGRWRVEAALGVVAIALGGALVGVMTIVFLAFRGQLDATVMGVYLGERVRPFHLALGVISLVVGGLAAGQIVTLSYLERQRHLAVRRALGWPVASVLRMLAVQALALGVIGGLVGTAVTWGLGSVLGAPIGSQLAGMGISALAGGIAGMLAAVGPILHAGRSTPIQLLRGE